MRATRILIGTFAFTAVLVLVSSSSGRLPGGTIEAHTFLNRAHQAIVVWQISTGIAVARPGSTDVLTVGGNTLTFSTQHKVFERIRYLNETRPWHVIEQRFLVTRPEAVRALQSARVVRVAAAAPAPSDVPAPPVTFTDVQDFGANPSALAHSVPFPVVGAEGSLLGHRLVDAYLMTVSNTFRQTNSGPVATLVYSLDPSRFGAENDDEIVINIADASSGWGNADAQLIANKAPNDDGTVPTVIAPGIVKVNPYQLVMHLGTVYISVSTTAAPLDSVWKALALSLHKL